MESLAPSQARLVINLVVTIVCVAATHASADGSLPNLCVPDSCGVQLKGHNFTIEELDRVYQSGFRIVRRGFIWSSIEKEKGVYDYSDYDAQMEHAKKLGLTVVGCIFGGNKLYEDDGQGGIQTKAGRLGFGKFAGALAKHYQDNNVLWEIWNEPNARTFWRKNGRHNSEEFAGEYTELVKLVAKEMLAKDPDCFILAGSVSNYWEPSYRWTESCFKRGILETGIRGWSVHPYGVNSPEEFAVGHARTRSLLRKYGAPDLPIMNTERGFAAKETPEGWSGGSKERAREFQSWNFVRQFLIDQSQGVRLTVWYEWQGDKFGIFDKGNADHDHRSVQSACQTMFKQLGGYHVVSQLETDLTQDYVMVFEDEVGNKKIVAWTSPPVGGTPGEATKHEVAIPFVRYPVRKDLDGKAIGTVPSASVIRLTLSGAPQYVAVPANAQLGRCTQQSPSVE